MITAKEIAYHAAREKACRDNAARAADEDTAARHHALAELHAARQRALEAGEDVDEDVEGDFETV